MLIQILPLVTTMVLGLTFLASGSSKLRNPQGFMLGVLEYDVLPPRLAVIYARILPIVEVILGLALVLGRWPTAIGLLSFVLLTSFLVAVLINIARGRRLDCHCYGSRKGGSVGGVTLARLCVYLICAAFVAVGYSSVRLLPASLDIVPTLFLAISVLLGLYLLSAVPPLWRVWNTRPVLGVTVNGGRISLRDQPLESRILLADESRVILGKEKWQIYE